MIVLGWDVGGAHLKAARIEARPGHRRGARSPARYGRGSTGSTPAFSRGACQRSAMRRCTP